MKTILVGTDFSATAFNAACYAADMALALGKDLLLLNIYTIPVAYYEVPIVINEQQMVQDLEDEMNKLKEQLLQRISGKVLIKTALRVGTFFTELSMVCEQVKPYAVVLGSQGSTVAERLFLGGHVVYTMKHLNWPLIAVPPDAHFSGIRKIGLACDLNDVAATVPANRIKSLTADFNAELHILNSEQQRESSPKMARESGVLHEMLQTVKPHYHYIVQEQTDQSIMNATVENHIDLLIVLPKHHSLPHLLMHKSHTRQLAMHCHVPVMTLP
ncbi:MAG: universal stress protein [Chitinophaga sp.]|uniref:universal stress protein n=1 Tax=Chitinophaga sp. TaxID=1869181 RepID=UPI001B265A04|nr:universal stress protein [Chitinophaga sp.]MBO9729692.1 universal stress protein [Chitinophaga sp.]